MMENNHIDRLEAHIREMRCRAERPFKSGNLKSMYGEHYTDRAAAQEDATSIYKDLQVIYQYIANNISDMIEVIEEKIRKLHDKEANLHHATQMKKIIGEIK